MNSREKIIAEAKQLVANAKARGLLGGTKSDQPPPPPPIRDTRPRPSTCPVMRAAPVAHKLAIAVEQITPAIARDWLRKNTFNRRLKKWTVAAYARDMRNGKWILTHQGLAFDDDERLLDGQHRLNAVIQSNTTVPMLVIRGIPSVQVESETMEAVDRGVTRTIADQLKLKEYTDPNLIAGSVAKIARICCMGFSRPKLTTADTLAILDLYSPHVEHVLQNRSKLPGLRSALLLGTMMFARAGAAEEIDPFYHSLVTGEGLAARSPALILRNWLMGGAASVKTINADTQSEMILHAAHAEIEKRKLDKMTWNRTGAEFFRDRQSATVAKVLALFRTTPE